MAEQIADMNVRIEQMAAVLNKSVARVRQLTQDDWLETVKVQGEAGRMYPLIANVQKYIGRLEDRLAGRKETNQAIKEADLEKREIDNEIRGLRLAEARREVIRVDDMMEVFGAFVTRTRVNMLAVGVAVAPTDKSLAGKINDNIKRAMAELATFDIKDFAEHGGTAYLDMLEQEAGILDADADDALEE